MYSPDDVRIAVQEMFGGNHFPELIVSADMPDQASLTDLDGEPHARPFEGGEPMVVYLTLSPEERVDPHTHPEREIVFSVHSGTIELDLDDEAYTLEAGDVIRFDGQREVSPYAVEESEALIVLAQRSDS